MPTIGRLVGPALLERGWGRDLPATRSVFTIHNIAYQGSRH